MPTPTNRTPVRVARGTYSNLNTNKADIQEGEICYATDQDKLYVKEGSNLVDATPGTDITGKANIASPTFTGTPAAPTASQGTDTTQIATTAFVNAEIAADTAAKAPLASPTFTGTPAAPTASSGTNTTQLATTAFVTTAVAAGGGLPDLSQADVNIHGLTVGQGSGNVSTNTVFGDDALQNNTSGNNNTAIGYDALANNTTGYFNTAVGADALEINQGGHNNTAIGEDALRVNSSGNYNTAIGTQASPRSNVDNTVAVGAFSLLMNTTGQKNTALGYQTLETNTTGSNNTAVGYTALKANTNAGSNTAVGYECLKTNTTGEFNTAVGDYACGMNTSGYYNVGIGYRALKSHTSGYKNVAIGQEAMGSSTSSEYNVAIGDRAGYNITTGRGNIVIGEVNNSGTFSPMSTVGSNNNRIHLGHSSIGVAYVQVAWSIASDKRDKMNFAPVPHGLDFVNQLKPTAFQYKLDRNTETPNGNVRYGFIAQDILALEGDNPVLIDNEDANRLKYTGENLIPVLVNAVQELTAKVKHLEDEIKTLKG